MTALKYLKCPICGSPLEKTEHSFLCVPTCSVKRHCFDISASGYADLSHRNGGSGDPKDAVRDRTVFLDQGYYQPLSDEINRICEKYLNQSALIVDAGCGEGYYSERIAQLLSDSFLIGVDLSKHAIHKASTRRNVRGGNNSFYAVASIFELPIRDNCADCVLSMFAPIAESEVRRVLKDGCIFVVGAAGASHLLELKSAIYDEVHYNDIRADLPSCMKLIDKTNITYHASLRDHDDIIRLFGMTPYKFRTSDEAFKKLCALDQLEVEINVDFFVYQKQ